MIDIEAANDAVAMRECRVALQQEVIQHGRPAHVIRCTRGCPPKAHDRDAQTTAGGNRQPLACRFDLPAQSVVVQPPQSIRQSIGPRPHERRDAIRNPFGDKKDAAILSVLHVRAHVQKLMMRQRRSEHLCEPSSDRRPQARLRERHEADVRRPVVQIQLQRHAPRQPCGINSKVHENHIQPVRREHASPPCQSSPSNRSAIPASVGD